MTSTATTSVLGVAENARWDLDHFTMFNITTFPAIVCYPAPAVHASGSLKGAGSSDFPAVTAAPAWVPIDHSGSSSGLDYNRIADGLSSCAARGETLRRYVEEYEEAMRDAEL